jgi:CHAT domain-containing protein/tetratricopeptide (TPR) repeat protein
MPSRLLSGPGRLFGPAVAILFLLLIAPALAAPVQPEETVPLRESRERPIAPGEAQAWRVVVPPDRSVLVAVEQQSIDLVVEARRPESKQPVAVTASRDRWGSEVLLLDGAGEIRIEVRSRDKSAWPGRYTLRFDDLPKEKDARRDALALMSRAGRETLPDTPASRQRAEATYRAALVAWRALGDRAWEADDRAWEAEALTSLAMLEDESSDLPTSTADFLAALPIWRELGKPQREADALNWLGVIYKDTEGTEKARETLESAVSLWRGLGERFDEEQAHGNLCFLEANSGSLPKALTCNQETLDFFRGQGVPTLEAEILNRIGGVYDLQGEPDEALDSYQKALALWRTLGDHGKEATTLNNIAVVYRKLGDWQEALRFYDQSREVCDPLSDPALAATLLNNTAYCYINLGEPRRALGLLEDALELHRKVGNGLGEVFTLNNLGLAWRKLGEPKKALDWHRRALALATRRKDAQQQAVSRLGLAQVDLDRGDPAAVLREIETALPALQKKGDRHYQANALYLQGRALSLAGRPREAIAVLQEVLARQQSVRDRAGEAETLSTLAAAERSVGLATEARSHAEAAVNLVEELRTGVLSVDLRASFLATRRRSYSLLIDLLMDRNAADPGKGHDREAFAISERARARGLLDVLRAGSAGHTASTASPDLLTLRTSLLRRLSAKVNRRWMESGTRAEDLDKEIDGIHAKIDEVEADIRRHDPRFAAFSAPQPVSPKEISGGLEPGTMLLEYSLGDERSFLWAIEAGQVRSFVLPGQAKIEALARQVYKTMSTVESGSARQGDAAAALGKMLLGPIWSHPGRSGPLQRLVVVPDGVLAILPFAALPVPDPGKTWQAPGTLRPLLERLEVVSIPSATTLAVQRQRLQKRAEAPRRAAVFADPVFAASDPRLAHRSTEGTRGPGPGPRLERLPATHGEADAVASLAPAGEVTLDLGLAASREAVLAAGLRDYRVIHFATHALADLQNPELSGLMLSQVDAKGHPREGFLGLSDIYELDLNADLVVLSGCKTALGKEVRGEGLMGLTRGFQYAGVPRVVASLWPVQDHTTAELMTRFYRAMWRDHLPAAAALREAQLSLRSDHRYRDPYSWAGFVLQGDWR